MGPFEVDNIVADTYWPELENADKIGDYGTGYYGVLLVETSLSRTGYRFDYLKFGEDNGRYVQLVDNSIFRLRTRVIARGYKWKILDAEKAFQTLTMNTLDLCYKKAEKAEILAINYFNEIK